MRQKNFPQRKLQRQLVAQGKAKRTTGGMFYLLDKSDQGSLDHARGVRTKKDRKNKA